VIRAENLSLTINAFTLGPLSLDIPSGEYFVLMGPAGSGKSVFLECLCGLKRFQTGRVMIGGADVTDRAPGNRPVAYVPQDYALFPHLSVERNIAFGLRAHGRPAIEARRRAAETAKVLGIEHLLSRATAGLSGGERQRVALARALVLEPTVLLLDEPVSALDEATRQDVCAQLLAIHRRFALTTIHVSHNQEEACTLADRAGVLSGGTLVQTGTMEDLLRRPRSVFVARFMRCENLLAGRAADDGGGELVRVAVDGEIFHVPGARRGALTLVIRPEDIEVRPNDAPRTINDFSLTLVRARSFGSYVRLEFTGAFPLVAHVQPAAVAALAPGRPVRVHIPPERIHVLA
jgi:molybdate/tungstate transport system ATP-binding protein